MTDGFYTVEVRAERVEGAHRTVTLPSGHAFEVGVHGPIKEHYGLHHEPDLPLPVDYIVGAGCA